MSFENSKFYIISKLKELDLNLRASAEVQTLGSFLVYLLDGFVACQFDCFVILPIYEDVEAELLALMDRYTSSDICYEGTETVLNAFVSALDLILDAIYILRTKMQESQFIDLQDYECIRNMLVEGFDILDNASSIALMREKDFDEECIYESSGCEQEKEQC